MNTLLHYSVYVPYTGHYAFRRVDYPGMDHYPVALTKNEKEVTCPICIEKLKEGIK